MSTITTESVTTMPASAGILGRFPSQATTSPELSSRPTPHECDMRWRLSGRVPGGRKWMLYVCECGAREKVSV